MVRCEEEAILGQFVASSASNIGAPSDVFVITHYPRYIRPFNVRSSDLATESTTNSFDIIIRGQECCSAAQLIHTYEDIRAAMSAN
jgi:aspartyl/asparaginyl-tRNA synthetase